MPALTTAGAIDIGLRYTDQIGPVDADNATRRTRALQYLQETVDYIWSYREWPWTYKASSNLTPVNGSISVPADFLELGVQGGIFNKSNNLKMNEVPFQQILMQRERNSGRTDEFALFGFDATSGLLQIQVVENVTSGATPLKLWYRSIAPTLVDSATAGNNLGFVPPAYHETVIVPGLVWRLRESKGDARDWWTKYQEGLGWMIRRERPRKSATQKMPLATGMW